MKVICEIYRDETNELGEIGKRAKHSLDFVDTVQYLNLPDEFMNLADEYVVRVILLKKRYTNFQICVYQFI
jgi:hypothetical protein